MFNGMVLVCLECGNIEITAEYTGGEKKLVTFYCPGCKNTSSIKGFAAGPIRLDAREVKKIKTKAEPPDRASRGAK